MLREAELGRERIKVRFAMVSAQKKLNT